jgi:ribosome-binding protein aMBF1 (putative translation factor)
MKQQFENSSFTKKIHGLLAKYPTASNYIHIIESLKESRKSKGLTIAKLANKIRFKAIDIAKIENYEEEATTPFILSYAKAVGMPIEVIKEK